jgi:hypothetical protein
MLTHPISRLAWTVGLSRVLDINTARCAATATILAERRARVFCNDHPVGPGHAGMLLLTLGECNERPMPVAGYRRSTVIATLPLLAP